MTNLRSGRQLTTMSRTNEQQTTTLSASDFPTTPYSGIIDLNTEAGKKLYLRATEPLLSTEKHLSSTNTPYQQFMDYIKEDSKNFGYGNEVHAIKNSSTTTEIIINQSSELLLEHVQKSSYKVWGNSSYDNITPLPSSFIVQDLKPWLSTDDYNSHFLRIRSTMLAIRLKKILVHSDYTSLMASKEKFIWKHENGQEEYNVQQ